MADTLKTADIYCDGGLILSTDALQQGKTQPGSATRLVNMEPHPDGGYRRIPGYTKFDSSEVDSTGSIYGVAVFQDTVIAACGEDVFKSSGSGWSKINGTSTRPSANKYRFTKYAFTGSPTILFVDGTNHPAKYDGTTYTEISDSSVTGATHVATFANHTWYAKGSTLIFTAPNTDSNFTAGDGAGTINVGHEITGIKSHRDILVVFCENRIRKVTGKALADFAIYDVTNSLGCRYSDSIREINGDIVFMGPDGLRLFSTAERIADFNLNAVSAPVQSKLTDLVTDFSDLNGVVLNTRTQYRIFGYTSGAEALSSRGIGMSIQSKPEKSGAQFFELQGMKVQHADSDFNTSNEEIVVFANNDSRYIYQMDTGSNFNGSSIPWVYQTPYMPFDNVFARKNFRKIKLFMKVGGTYDYDVELKLDYNSTDVIQPDSDTVSTDDPVSEFGNPVTLFGDFVFGRLPSDVVDVALVGTGFTASFIFSGENTNNPFSIQSFSIQYSLHGLR